MKAIAVYPGPRTDSIHLATCPSPRSTTFQTGAVSSSRCCRSASTAPTRRSTRPSTGRAPPATTTSSSATRASAASSKPARRSRSLAPGDLRRRDGAPPGLEHLRRDRPPGLHHRRRVLRARHQPAPWLFTEYYVDEAALVPLPALGEVGVLLEPTSVPRKRSARPTRSSAACASGSRSAPRARRRHVGPARASSSAPWPRRRHYAAPAPLPQQQPARGDRRPVPELAKSVTSPTGGRARPLRPDPRRHRLQPARLPGDGGLGKNGVLVLVSVTGGDRTIEVHADRINQGFVLGNKVMVGSVNAPAPTSCAASPTSPGRASTLAGLAAADHAR